jgi:hypothetical protein
MSEVIPDRREFSSVEQLLESLRLADLGARAGFKCPFAGLINRFETGAGTGFTWFRFDLMVQFGEMEQSEPGSASAAVEQSRRQEPDQLDDYGYWPCGQISITQPEVVRSTRWFATPVQVFEAVREADIATQVVFQTAVSESASKTVRPGVPWEIFEGFRNAGASLESDLATRWRLSSYDARLLDLQCRDSLNQPACLWARDLLNGDPPEKALALLALSVLQYGTRHEGDRFIDRINDLASS